MAKTAWCWVNVVFFLLCSMAPAEAALPVPHDGVLLRNSGELEYLVDPTDRLTPEDLRRGDMPWQPVTAKAAIPRSSMQPVWVRFRIAPASIDMPLILYQPVARQLELNVYAFEGDTKTASYETGNGRPFATRPLPHRYFLFPLSLHAGQPLDIYIRVRGHPPRTTDFLQLWPEQKLLTQLPREDAFEWANIGVMTVTLLATTLLWVFVRQRLLGLFALFVAAQLGGFIISRGYGFEWLWSGWPRLDLVLQPVIVLVSMVVNTSFSMAFLDFKHHFPRLYGFVRKLLWCSTALLVATPFWPIGMENLGYALLAAMYLFLLAVSLYMFVSRKNSAEAGVFLLCSGIYIVFIVVVMLGLYVWWYPTHLIDFGQLLRTLLFAACLGYRFRKVVRSEESARADSRAKSEFLARMSHEIRTPMNGILGMSEMLRSTPLDATQHRYNEIVYSSATALLRIIDDILDFSKIQAGRMTVENVPFNLYQLANDTLALFRGKAEAKHIALKFDLRVGVPVWVSGDPTRLRQILNNLLSNAVKFTAAGEIRLLLSKGAGSMVHIAVSDTGPGIAPDAQQHLFEAFMQADVSIARQHGGTGLGLAISQQLATLMGGQIRVQSKPGEGTTFYLELPLPAAEPIEEFVAKPADSSQQPLMILVVEDNFTNQLVVEAMLERLGHRFTIVSSGPEAIAFYEKNHASIDLIFMDCEMPDMSGYEATRQIRALELQNRLPPKPITALTAHALDEHIRQCRDAGMNDHLAKPLVIEALQEYLAAFAAATLPPQVPA